MRSVVHTIIEFIAVTAVGTVIALAANGLNNRGVSLSTDYFPRLKVVLPSERPTSQPATRPVTQSASAAADQSGSTPDPAVEAIVREGLQPISHDEVIALFGDPLYEAGVFVFIDARDDHEYQQAHIPGAWQLDHYQLDRYIDAVLPACQQAVKIVTYCNGGDCEDSRFAAIDLIGRGIDPGRIYVYPGGFTRWRESGQPIERGPRRSTPAGAMGDPQ
jgi:rhodanese-related sulfurtransferase